MHHTKVQTANAARSLRIEIPSLDSPLDPSPLRSADEVRPWVHYRSKKGVRAKPRAVSTRDRERVPDRGLILATGFLLLEEMEEVAHGPNLWGCIVVPGV